MQKIALKDTSAFPNATAAVIAFLLFGLRFQQVIHRSTPPAAKSWLSIGFSHSNGLQPLPGFSPSAFLLDNHLNVARSASTLN
jgi:hypothetical protein